MTRPPRLDTAGTVTHVIARGNERRPLFRDDDRETYLELLGETCGRHGARVLSFCLMPNHVHLALQTGPAPVSRVVHDLHSRYAQYFNHRHGRSGHLFQGRFRGLVIDRDAYLLEMVRYQRRRDRQGVQVSELPRRDWLRRQGRRHRRRRRSSPRHRRPLRPRHAHALHALRRRPHRARPRARQRDRDRRPLSARRGLASPGSAPLEGAR